ncbi:MAG: hypothetical protein WCA46_04985 [Actinocatenispora sp.]
MLNQSRCPVLGADVDYPASTPIIVWWEVGSVTYSLRLQPSEGGTITQTQFKRELARLTWS